MKILKQHFLYVTILFIAAIPSFFPLIQQKGFIKTDDADWMVIRFSSFYEELRNGQLPPRILGRLNHEYGYPVGNFLYPGFMYIATPFKVLGLSFVDSIKAVLILFLLSSSFFMYFWLTSFFSKLSSAAGALYYLYVPYHMFDVYIRGSVGELMGLAFLPLLFFLIERKKWIAASFVYGIILLSHNIFALLVTPCIAFYIALFHGYKKMLVLLGGLFLTSFFWIPALYDLQYTVFSQTKISSWEEYNISLFSRNNQLLGMIGFFIGVFAILFLFNRRNKKLLFFSFLYLGGIFFAMNISSFVWKYSPLPLFVQFPWRFLIIASFAGAFIVSSAVSYYKKITNLTICFIGIVLAISTVPYFQSIVPVSYEDGYYFTNESTTTTASEYMPRWVKKIPDSRPINLVDADEVSIIMNVKKTNRLELSTSAQKESTITINKTYFPGWKAFVNGKEISISFENDLGVIQFKVPAGINNVIVSFTETSVRSFADIISILTFFGLFIFSLKNYNFRKIIHIHKI